jgi:hypothetical protein
MYDKTNVRDTKDGVTTRKRNLYNFPKEIHEKALEISHGDITVGDVYSEAISRFRRGYDSGSFNSTWIIKAERGSGSQVQVWITVEADEDLKYLREVLREKNVHIVYSAMFNYFHQE